MNDKEFVVFLTMVKDQLKKGDHAMALLLIDEKIKKIGLKLSNDIISSKSKKKE